MLMMMVLLLLLLLLLLWRSRCECPGWSVIELQRFLMRLHRRTNRVQMLPMLHRHTKHKCCSVVSETD